jgi:aldehyde dehydrogenase (NAD+)
MDFLSTLKIDPVNKGVSTGTQWIASNGEIIDSFSPVDGKKIGAVIAADKDSYETVIKKAEHGVRYRHQKEGK